MIVRFRGRTPEPSAILGLKGPMLKQDLRFSEGREYVVIGVDFAVDSRVHGTGTWLHLVNDDDRLSWAPLGLFDVTDPRVSSQWELRQHADGQVTLWPPALYREFFHDDLSEREAEVIAEFQRVRESLEAEAGLGPKAQS